MKCTNPLKCDGEMSAYEGIQAGCVECVKCGYRTAESKPDVKKPDVKKVSNKEGENI